MKIVRKRRWGRWVLAAALVLGLAVAAYVLWGRQAPAPQQAVPAPVPQKIEPKPVSLTSDVLFLGNSFWGRYTHDYAMKSPLKYAYPFSRLHELQRDRYNAWVSGLECPMKASVQMSTAEQEKELQFNCSPDFLPEAKKWFTAFSLANNHTDNQGADGFRETQKHLEKQGIQYFGHYDPAKLDDVCEVIALPVSVRYSDASTKKAQLPVAMCAYHGVFGVPPQAAVDEMKQYSALMPVFALPHMGAEYKPAPDQIKTDFYRGLIDAGADVVLGDHPHWVQSTESYKGRLIVYSMGNFMFDQDWNPELLRSAAIHTRLTAEGGALADWLALGEACGAHHDDCPAEAKQQKLAKLDMRYGFKAIGTTTDRKAVTGLADSSAQQSILERLKWPQTMRQLRAPYSAL
jgi:hypothetical protein